MAALLLCGCQVKDVSDGLSELMPEHDVKVFTAVIDDNTSVGTKTSLDNEGNVLWKQGDQVSIFAGSTINEQYQVTDESDGETSASLYQVTSPGFVAGTDINNNVAFYPYAAATTISKSGNAYTIKKVNLPAIQNYVEASFGNGAFPMAAVTTSTTDMKLKFKNVLGGLKLQLKGTATIASISITGNNNEILCGAAEVTASNTSTPTISLTDATAKTVTLDCGNGVQLNLETPTFFIIALPPMTMEGGFTVIVTDTENKQMEIKTTKSQTITRSYLLKMPAVTYEGTPAVEHQFVDLGLPSGLKWATCNVGADNPEDYGDYFAWGETEPHYNCLDPLTWKEGKEAGYAWQIYQWCEGSLKALYKYCTNSFYGTVDNRAILELGDDAARDNWSGTWRLPTDEEWTELRENCTWTWTTRNGVDGYLVTGSNNNRMFLPAAGSWSGVSFSAAGSCGWYWSSSTNPDRPACAYSVFFDSGYVRRNYDDRDHGFSVRPVTDDGVRVPITSISLDYSSISLTTGESATIVATVLPANATQPSVIWSSSNTNVASVDYAGVVKAIWAGTTTITAATYDGSLTATCTVTVSGQTYTWPTVTGTIYGHDWVDLGLPSGLKWATSNVGASRTEEYGDYFAWGETEPYYNSRTPLVWKEGKEAGYSWESYRFAQGTNILGTYSKYVTNVPGDHSFGTVDNNTVLDSEDDAASANWGGNWRMPTDAEWGELIDECTWTWTTQNGVNGYLVTGSNNNRMFLPAAGERLVTGLYGTRSTGYYWSSSLYMDYPSHARCARLNPDRVFFIEDDRCGGNTVRPVIDELVTSISLDHSSISLTTGESATIVATVLPANVTQLSVIWSSSNTNVASVDCSGVVTAIGTGTATITATTYNSCLTATCDVTVSDFNGHDWVDLGLPSGLKWATCNVGADNPEDYGDYFAWGETEPHYTEGHSRDTPCSNWKEGKTGYFWSSYKWLESETNRLTKYNTISSYGTVDNNTTLELADDAARENWGGSWRIPTIEEIDELTDASNCIWTWTTQNGVKGCMVTSKTNGNYIFFPASGKRDAINIGFYSDWGIYMSSSLDTDNPSYLHTMFFTQEKYNSLDESGRYQGIPIRPVAK